MVTALASTPVDLALLESAGVLVSQYSFTPAFTVHYISRNVEEFLGVPAEELTANPARIFDAVHPDDRQLLETAFASDQTDLPPVTLRWRHPGGRVVWCEHFRLPLPPTDDDGQSFVSLSFDVSAQMTLVAGRQHLTGNALRALSKRVEHMREAERARIARELHDELGQLLTGTKLDFSFSLRRLRDLKVPGDVVDKLQSAMGQIDIGIQMVRRIATDLRPPALDHRDLGAAIEDEARRVSARSDIPVRVANRLDLQVSPEVATTAFRVFQEALTNAVRHAQPSLISVTLGTTRHGHLMLNVRDNGVGIRRQQIPGRLRGTPDALGLLGMRERAQALGGEVRIRSTVGRGTKVVLTLPLEGGRS